MALLDRIKELEQNPLFKELTYSEQVEMRSQLFNSEIQKIPDFFQLPNEQKIGLYNEAIFREPVFEGTDVKEHLYAFSKRLHFDETKTQGEKINGWAQMLTLGKAVTENITLANIFKGVTETIGWLTSGEDYVPYTKDTNKVYDYINYQLNADERFGKINELGKNILGGAAFIADTALLYSKFVGTFTKPQGIVKPLMQGVGILERKGVPDIALRGLRSAFHSIGGGLVGVTRESIKDWAWSQNGFQDPTVGSVLDAGMKHFGDYAIGDFLFFAGTGALKRIVPWMTQPFTRSSKFLRKFNLFRGLEDDVMTGMLKLDPKKPQQFGLFLKDALSGNIPKGLYENLDDAGKAIVDACQSLSKVRDFTKMEGTDLLKVIAKSQGYGVLEQGGKWKLFGVDDKLLGTFSDWHKLTQNLSDRILGDVKVPLTTKEFQTIGAGMQRVELKQTIKGEFKGEVENVPELLTKIIAPEGGKLQPSQVSGFAKSYLSGGGVDDALVSSIRSMPTEDGIKLFIGAEEVANVPKIISNPLDEKKAIEGILDGLGKFLPEEKTLDVNRTKTFLNAYETELKKQKLFTPDWVEMAVREQWDGAVRKVSPERYIVETPKGPMEFSSYEEIGNALLRDSVTVETLRQHLQQYEGIQLNTLADDKLELVKPGMKPTRFENLDDLLLKNPELTPKISSTLGPQLTFVDSTVTGVKYQGKTVTGDYQAILRELDRFKDFSASKKVRIYSGKKGIIDVNPVVDEFTVRLQDLNYERTFKTKEEAVKFLQKGVDDFASLELIANEKGLRLGTQNGKFLLYDQSRQMIYNSMDELKNGLSQIAPSPSYMPELTGMDSKIFDGIEKNVEFNIKPNEYPDISKGPAKTGWFWNLQNMFNTPDRQFYTAVKKGASPKELMVKYGNIESALRLQMSYDHKFKGLIDQLFTDPITGKKMVDGVGGLLFNQKYAKLRRSFKEVLESPIEQWDNVMQKLNIDPKYKPVIENIRSMWDELASFYNIPPEKQINNYFSHLRAYADTVDLTKYVDTDTGKFLEDAFKQNVPKELHQFFDHVRMSEFVQFIQEKDPLVTLTKYVIAGNRKKFLGPSISDSWKWLVANKKSMAPGVFTRYAYFLDEVAGLPHQSYNMDNIRAAGEELLNVLPFLKKNPKVRGDFTSKLFSLSYMSTMAWRPSLMTRNAHQIFTTLGSRFGFQNVSDAMKLLAEDSGQIIYKRLKNLGILQVDLPIAGSKWMQEGSKLTKIATLGLQGYRNSDELTRAIAYLTAENMFEKAYKKFQAGGINQGQFLKQSGISMMDDVVQDRIGQLLNSGQNQGALNLYASTVVRDTMFPYIPGMGGTISKQSVIGKIFGAYGHYPMWYRANIARGLRQGTLPQKVAFATRWIGGGLAMASFYGAIGIGATNFIPWQPMFFNGGPYYDLVNALLEFPDSALARSEVLGGVVGMKDNKPYIDPTRFLDSKVVRSFLPTTYQLRALGKGVKYLNDGDYWKAFVAMTSAPVVEADPFANWRNDWIVGNKPDSFIPQMRFSYFE